MDNNVERFSPNECSSEYWKNSRKLTVNYQPFQFSINQCFEDRAYSVGREHACTSRNETILNKI